jgi:hemolysin III
VIEALPLEERPQSLGEEIANSVSHGAALLAATAAAPVLIVGAVQRGGATAVVGASVFAATVLLLYLTSTLYHALPRNRAKPVFQVLDHAAIYLLIAGTYTPFTLGVLSGPWGWTLFGIVWGLAFAGVVLKAVDGLARAYRAETTVGFRSGLGTVLVVRGRIRLHGGRVFFRDG